LGWSLVGRFSALSHPRFQLWFIGGNECIISKEVFMCVLQIAGRCLTIDSHKINKKNITEMMEIIDPTLAIIFQNIKLSG